MLLVLFAVGATCVRRALWPLGVILAVVPWAVYLQIIPFTTWSMAGERFLFVSVGGLALILVDLLGCLAQARRIVALLLLITLPLAAITWNRLADWEFGYQLHAREYERQPGFHNAIRDQVFYVLLPKRQYAEAESLAGSIARDYAAAALLAFIDAERAFAAWNDGRATGSPASEASRSYCLALASLRRALTTGYAQIPSEHDLSYNNLLRSIERQTKLRVADDAKACGDATTGA